MDAIDIDEVAERRRRMELNGYSLVPVVTGGKEPVGQRWQHGVVHSALFPPHPGTLNTGMRTARLRVVDVDVDGITIVAKIREVARQVLGGDPLVRCRDNSSRCALIYRAAEGAPRKRSTKTSAPNGKVEILGDGQQYVVDGTHPSGASLLWEGDRAPWTSPLADLPALTEDAVSAFLMAIEPLVGAPPDRCVSVSGLTVEQFFDAAGPIASRFLGRPRDNDLAAGIRPPLNLVELRSAASYLALAGIMKDYDRWRDLLLFPLALAAQETPEGERDLKELIDEVSALSGGDTTKNDELWRKAISAPTRANPMTTASIYAKARELGWTSPVVFGGDELTSTGKVALASTQPPCGSVPIASLEQIPPKREWLYGMDLLRGAITLLVAPGARGKSSLMVSAALACASGRSLLGDHVFGGPLRVLLANAEDSTLEIARKVRAAMIHHKLADADVPGLFVAGADALGLTLLYADKGQPRLYPASWATLAAELDRTTPDILMLDPLVSLLGGVSINDNAAAALLIGELVRLAAVRNMSIMIAHHARKGGEAGNVEAAMGAASLSNLARIALSIEPMDEKIAPALGVDPLHAPSHFRLVSTKANLSPPAGGDRWFRLASVELANARPPVYPHGDRVGVVERFIPNPSAQVYPPTALNAAMLSIRTASPPFSPKLDKGSEGLAALAKVIAPHRQGRASPADVRAIVDHLIDGGRVVIRDVKVPRDGRGSYTRRGLVVVGASSP